MASPDTLQFDALLAAIPGENPAGEDLRQELSSESVFRQIRTLRAQAREAERQALYDEQASIESQAMMWRPILKLAPAALAARSKDLEIVAFLTEALVREHGFAGLRDGFRLARELVERFWDNLYPRPEADEDVIDEEDIDVRVAPLAALFGREGEGVLAGPINRVAITQGTVGTFSSTDYRLLQSIESISDPDQRAERMKERGVVNKQTLEASAASTPPDWFRNLREDLAQARDEYDRLCRVLEEKCGEGESGHSLAPPSSQLSALLAEIEDRVRLISRGVLGDDESEQEGESAESLALYEAGGDGAMVSASNQARCREDAYRALLRAAEFFRRTEPHSPVSYLLEQAVRWGRMELPELLRELIPEDASREELFKRIGIKLREQEESG